MEQPSLPLPTITVADVEKKIEEVIKIGTEIRSKLGSRNNEPEWGEKWEVNAAVNSLNILSGKWTIEIMSALYITGEKRFNDLKHLLQGISSRTLSDKLKLLIANDYVKREVSSGPPVKVRYVLTEYGMNIGKLFSPIVGYIKINSGMIKKV
ncbi:MAG: hypothetical protein CMB56_003480 [Methanobacteriota archaeon]|nr:MAG: hypothetical protein CMB56_003480 [Euryarchaeota archaeon]|tara:strand:+ start:351 stop:806 length:456 start_codon:yes stop_codon:yes gene_type:complete